MTVKEIGENLKLSRQEKNKSIYDVEKETGIPHQYLYNWENGKIEPKITNCIKLAEYYGITLDNLIFFK